MPRCSYGFVVASVLLVLMCCAGSVRSAAAQEPAPPTLRADDVSPGFRSASRLPGSVSHGPKDATPPRIVSFSPAPGEWIVDTAGLSEVRIGFDEAVTIPAGAVIAWTSGGGVALTDTYDPATNTLVLTLPFVLVNDWLTVVVDYTVTDTVGNALDGEIVNPSSASLPSGDGVRGGQAVFRIHVLQGDANRDGFVDASDGLVLLGVLGLCEGDEFFNPDADLNGDGCVNVLDVAIFTAAEGQFLPLTDGVAPIVSAIFPDPDASLSGDIATVDVTFDEPLDAAHFDVSTCYLAGGAGTLHLPSSASLSLDGRTASYVFSPALPQCGTYSVNLSNALADPSGMQLVRPLLPPVLAGFAASPAPTVDPHPAIVNQTPVTLTGSAPNATSVEISGPEGVIVVPVTAGTFNATVALTPDHVNLLHFTPTSPCGVEGVAAVATITHDGEPPSLFIDFPADGAELTNVTADVGGRVADTLSGFMGLTVTVNGIPAIVNIGIGTNGTFLSASVPLVLGPNVLEATAVDELGNSVTRQVTVTRVAVPPNTPQMMTLSGNGQTGPIAAVLSQPVVVKVWHGDGTPFAGKLLTFDVTRSNGRMTADGTGEGGMMLQVQTDALGEARAFWRMGSDAGCGNNRLSVTSTDIAGTVLFCASATPGPATQINVGSGNNQRAEAGGPTTEPLRVWVNDACNGVANVPVTFTVTRGDGMVDGLTQVTVSTGTTGHAGVTLSLGLDGGNNVVEADFAGNVGMGVQFNAFGVVRDPAQPTNVSGLVLNNAGQPIGGATVTLTMVATAPLTTSSDTQGQFQFDAIANSGSAQLHIDGLTATTTGGLPVPAGSFPALQFDLVVVPNSENALTTPVLLPTLDPANVRVYDGTQDVVLTINGVEGLSMVVRAGSMRRADGSVPSPADPAMITLNQVHFDKVPMPIPDGAAPLLAWTLQPSGATFDPPVEVTYPNISGLPPGSIAYFLSFNHDTGRFEIVATGSVTDNGECILSDPGAGIATAGWGCNCPPYSVTGDCCEESEPNGCGAEGGLGFPSQPPGVWPQSFEPACDSHDNCYGSCGASRPGCDQDFCETLSLTCVGAGSPGTCLLMASAYCAGVVNFGGGAFSSAQEDLCDCPGAQSLLSIGSAEAWDRLSFGPAAFGGGGLPGGLSLNDSDLDLMDDDWEAFVGLSPNNPADAQEDPDADGLINLLEFFFAMDPFNSDTDGDGVDDLTQAEASQPPSPVVLDSSWLITVGGQTLNASDRGAFVIANVASPDFFGAGGPGTPPDFLGDDFVRATGISTAGDVTRYAFSEPFQIQRGVTFQIPSMTITTTPQPVPLSLAITTGITTLSMIGQTTQAQTTATLGDGTQQDVTPRTAWTVYRTSNTAIATVGQDGLVTAQSAGAVLITAVNEGTVASTRLLVVPGDPLTTVVGFVVDNMAQPVGGAEISIFDIPVATSDPVTGYFQASGIATTLGDIVVVATANVGKDQLGGQSAPAAPVPSMFTDVGIITVDTISVIPGGPVVALFSQTVQFTAQPPQGIDPAVTWAVLVPDGMDPLDNPGTITPDGLYTPPLVSDATALPTAWIRATSVQLPALTGTAVVQLFGTVSGGPPANALLPGPGNTGGLPLNVAIADPPADILLPKTGGADSGGLPLNVIVAKPSVEILLPETGGADTGELPLNVIVAKPPVEILLPETGGADSGGLPPNVTIAIPPVVVELPTTP